MGKNLSNNTLAVQCKQLVCMTFRDEMSNFRAGNFLNLSAAPVKVLTFGMSQANSPS